MFELLTDQEFSQLDAIPDKAFHKALMRSEFSRIVNGQRQINVYWLFPWAWSDDCGNRRYSATAVAVRAAWPAHTWFNRDNFLPEARQRRYS